MAEHNAQPGRTTPPRGVSRWAPREPAASWPTRGGHPVPGVLTRGRSDRPRSVTTGQGTTPVPSTAVGTTRGWAAHHLLMDGTTPAGTPTGTASRPALRRRPVVPAVASVLTHTSQGQDEAGGTAQGGARHEAPARTQQERGRRTADTEPTAQHGTGRRTGCARAAPGGEDEQAGARTAGPPQPHHDDAEQLQQGDSGLQSTTAASQTVADPAARWYCPEYYTPTYPAPRLGTDARCEPCRRPPRAMPLNARHRTTPQSPCHSPRRRCRSGCGPQGVDVPPAAPDCGGPTLDTTTTNP
jgi:hypothetical protein